MRAQFLIGWACVMIGGLSLWILHAPAWTAGLGLVVVGVGLQVRAERRT